MAARTPQNTAAGPLGTASSLARAEIESPDFLRSPRRDASRDHVVVIGVWTGASVH